MNAMGLQVSTPAVHCQTVHLVVLAADSLTLIAMSCDFSFQGNDGAKPSYCLLTAIDEPSLIRRISLREFELQTSIRTDNEGAEAAAVDFLRRAVLQTEVIEEEAPGEPHRLG